MNSNELKEIETLIISEIKETKEYISEYKEMTKPEAPDCAIGRVSRMDAINNRSVTEAALRSSEEKLKGLEYVLTKLDDPNFGKCARCNEKIAIKRIILRPQSVYCVRCAR